MHRSTMIIFLKYLKYSEKQPDSLGQFTNYTS
jgi:hypothetical protein